MDVLPKSPSSHSFQVPFPLIAQALPYPASSLTPGALAPWQQALALLQEAGGGGAGYFGEQRHQCCSALVLLNVTHVSMAYEGRQSEVGYNLKVQCAPKPSA